jgi:hypothetical protein
MSGSRTIELQRGPVAHATWRKSSTEAHANAPEVSISRVDYYVQCFLKRIRCASDILVLRTRSSDVLSLLLELFRHYCSSGLASAIIPSAAGVLQMLGVITVGPARKS